MRKRYLFLIAILLGALHGASCGHVVYGQTLRTESSTVNVATGIWHMAIRARGVDGQLSGWSNEIRIECAPGGTVNSCDIRLMWDVEVGGPTIAMFDLQWGSTPGLYINQRLIPPSLIPGKLPTPTLRIRR